jgi:hypothetical protein
MTVCSCMQHDIQRLDLRGLESLLPGSCAPSDGYPRRSVTAQSDPSIMARWTGSLTNLCRWEKMKITLPTWSVFFSQSGPVAQLGARFHGMEEVVGSIPTRSTIKSTT